MKKFIIIGVMALGLTSCGIDEGDFVYVRGDTETLFGYVITKNFNVTFVKLCDGRVVSASEGYMAEAPDGEVCQ